MKTCISLLVVFIGSLFFTHAKEPSWERVVAIAGSKYPDVKNKDSSYSLLLRPAISSESKRLDIGQDFKAEEVLEIADRVHKEMIENSPENIAREKAEYESATIIQHKRDTNSAAWELVKKEFPHLYFNGKPNAETVRWMREWDEYYKVHDPALAKNPARPIYYARMNDQQQREANAAARQAAAELYESRGQRAIDEIKAEIQATQRQAQANAEQARAAIEAAQESNKRQQAEFTAQMEKQRRQQLLDQQQQEDQLRIQREVDANRANPNRFKGYSSH